MTQDCWLTDGKDRRKRVPAAGPDGKRPEQCVATGVVEPSGTATHAALDSFVSSHLLTPTSAFVLRLDTAHKEWLWQRLFLTLTAFIPALPQQSSPHLRSNVNHSHRSRLRRPAPIVPSITISPASMRQQFIREFIVRANVCQDAFRMTFSQTGDDLRLPDPDEKKRRLRARRMALGHLHDELTEFMDTVMKLEGDRGAEKTLKSEETEKLATERLPEGEETGSLEE